MLLLLYLLLLILVVVSVEKFQQRVGEYLPHHTEIDKELEENNFILKKEGFYKPFVVLILRCRKIEKKLSGKIKSDISRPDPFISLEGAAAKNGGLVFSPQKRDKK